MRSSPSTVSFRAPPWRANSIQALRQFVSVTDNAQSPSCRIFTIGRDIELKRLVAVPMREKRLALASIEAHRPQRPSASRFPPSASSPSSSPCYAVSTRDGE